MLTSHNTGTAVGFDVKDATGAIAQTAFVAIQSSCESSVLT